MKTDPALHPLPVPQSPLLPLPRPDLPRVLLVSERLVTTTVGPMHASPETLALQNLEIVVVLPVVLEITGYRHGGIND